MGLKSAWNALATGDFRDSFNYLLTDEDALETQKLIQTAHEARIARQYDEGLIGESEAGELMSMAAGSAYPYLWHNEAGGDPAKVFGDSIKDSTKEAASQFSTAFGTPAKWLPWWLWLILIGAVVLYFWPAIAGALSFRSKLFK